MGSAFGGGVIEGHVDAFRIIGIVTVVVGDNTDVGDTLCHDEVG